MFHTPSFDCAIEPRICNPLCKQKKRFVVKKFLATGF